MWNIIVAICLVFAVCGPVWAISRYLKISLPKFVLPVVAGVTLMSFNAYMRYTWGDRTMEAFPSEIVTLKEYRSSTIFEPWTYLVPRVSHLMAADTRETRTNDKYPGVILGSLVMLQEHQSTLNMTVLVNCSEEKVSVVPAQSIVEGADPVQAAQWTRASEFPEVAAFYCKS